MLSPPSPPKDPPWKIAGNQCLKKWKERKQSKETKQTKQTKQTKKRHTKKEQDEAAVQKFLSSSAFNARVTMEVQQQLEKNKRSDRLQKVYNKAQKVMKEFALLADGDPDVYTEEGDLLLEYMGKMNKLQMRRQCCKHGRTEWSLFQPQA